MDLKPLALLLALACGHVPECISQARAELYGSNACDLFQAAEDRAQVAFRDNVASWSVNTTAIALQGYKVHVVRGTMTQEYLYPDGGTGRIDVLGYDNYLDNEAYIRVDVDTASEWAMSAFTHELAHQLQWDLSRVVDYYHTNWPTNGIDAAIRQATDITDPAP